MKTPIVLFFAFAGMSTLGFTQNIKFASNVEGVYLLGLKEPFNEMGGGAVSGGILMNNKTFIGASVGVFNSSIAFATARSTKNVLKHNTQTAQVSVNARYYFFGGKFSPFVHSHLGLNTALDAEVAFSNFFYEAGLGLNYKIVPKLAVYALGGYSAYTHKTIDLEFPSGGIMQTGTRSEFTNIPLRIGLTFVPKGW